MKGKKAGIRIGRQILILMICLISSISVMAQTPVAKKIFIFGDSMTGWMAERLQAYGEKNGFEVSTLIWDGATMKKYASSSAALSKYIAAARPDAVIVCLGMNEMASPDPAKQLSGSLNKIISTIGDIPMLWVGPCSWPGKPKWGPGFDKWMDSTLGSDRYFTSLGLKLARQSNTNPHPTRQGMNKWTDDIVKWIEAGDATFELPGYASPTKEFSRPKNYTYRKMKAAL